MRVTALLVKWNGGWRERRFRNIPTDLAARFAADGLTQPPHVEGLLGLGAVQSGDEADRIADRQLVAFNTPEEDVAAGVAPTTLASTPWLGYRPGDTIAVQGAAQRLIGLSVTEDADGQLQFQGRVE